MTKKERFFSTFLSRANFLFFYDFQLDNFLFLNLIILISIVNMLISRLKTDIISILKFVTFVNYLIFWIFFQQLLTFLFIFSYQIKIIIEIF